MADYDILENWEGPTTENKDWRKKLDKGIREDLSEGMIEPGLNEIVEDSPWYSDPEFYEAMVGWGEPGLGTAGDVGRDLWNQGMMFADFLGHTSPATLLMGGSGDSIFKDMMFKGDVYDKIYSKGDYRDVDKLKNTYGQIIKKTQELVKDGKMDKYDASMLNQVLGGDLFQEGNLSMDQKSSLNEIISSLNTAIEQEPDEIIAGWREAEIEAKDLPWYDPGNVDWTTMGKTAINEMFTPSNVAADNPYKDLANKIRVGGNIAPYVVSPITSGVRTVGSKVAPAVTKAITNSRFGKTLSNLKPFGIFPSLVNKLPKSMQETVRQLLPVTSGKGTFLPTRGTGPKIGPPNIKPTTWNPLTWGRPVTNRDWLGANTLRNWGIAGTMQGGKYLLGDNEVQAAIISDDWGRDSDPVIFDDYVSERIREPRDERRGPGPWNEFEG